MSWIRLGDDFVDDPAVLDLGDDESLAGWIYIRLVSYAAKHLTDGRIPAALLRREDPAAISALARAGLLERREDGDGYLPRFLEVRDSTGRVVGGHHPSRETVEARRAARSAAGKQGGEASGEARRQATSEASAKQLALQPDQQNGNPVSRTPVSPESPGPAPVARAGGDDDEVLFSAVEARGVSVNRSNGHAEMLRKRLRTYGLEAALRALATLDRPVADAGDAAKYIADVLRPRPGPESGQPAARSGKGTDYDALPESDDDATPALPDPPDWAQRPLAVAR